MIPDMMALLVIIIFGVSVGQRIRHTLVRDSGSLLQSIYGRTGLLLDIVILGSQAFCKLLNPLVDMFSVC